MGFPEDVKGYGDSYKIHYIFPNLYRIKPGLFIELNRVTLLGTLCNTKVLLVILLSLGGPSGSEEDE